MVVMKQLEDYGYKYFYSADITERLQSARPIGTIGGFLTRLVTGAAIAYISFEELGGSILWNRSGVEDAHRPQKAPPWIESEASHRDLLQASQCPKIWVTSEAPTPDLISCS
jgi:hypothetical protein